MKTILINRTLTTIALISSIQCGYRTGTASITSWYTLTNSGNTYTFGSDGIFEYTLNMVGSQYLTSSIKLIIPSSCTVTNIGFMNVNSTLDIVNNGTFINKIINNKCIGTTAENSSITFSGSGTINNYYWISTRRPSGYIKFSDDVIINNYHQGDIFTGSSSSGSVIEFTGNRTIYNYGAIGTFVANSSIVFSGGTDEYPQYVDIYASKDEYENLVRDTNGNIIYGQIYLGKASSSMTIGQYSILSFYDYGKFYAKESNGNVTLNGTIEIISPLASVDTTNISLEQLIT